MKSLRPAILYFAVLFAALIPAASARRTPSSALLRTVASHAGIAATAQGPTLLTTLLSGAVATGPGTDIGVRGLSVVGVQVTGITTATVTWEATIDGVTWASVIGTNSGSQAQATTATTNGIYTVNVAGKARFRPNVTAYTAGAITATILLQGQGIADGAAAGGGGGSGGIVTQATAANLNALVTQGAAGASAWPVSLAALPALTAGAATIGAVNLAQYTPASGRLPVDPSGVTSPVSLASLPALTAGAATIGAVNLAQYTPVTGRLPVDPSGVTSPVSLASLPALATGANVVGAVTQSGTWTVQPGNTANTTPWLFQTVAGTTGGATPFYFTSAGGANQDATVAKSGAGLLYNISAYNTTASARYVWFHDSTAPTSATACIYPVFLPAFTTGSGAVPVNLAVGLAFGTGISFRVTTGNTPASVAAASAQDVIIGLGYK